MAVAASIAARADVTANLRPQEIAPGESARLTVRINGKSAGAPELPRVDGLRFRESGQSSQIQIINGAMSSSMTYTYDVYAEREGVYTLPAIRAKVDGQRESSKPLPLRVSASGRSAFRTPGAGSLPPPSVPAGNGDPVAAADAGNRPAFVRLTPAKPELFVGEMAPIEIKAYFLEGLHATVNALPTIGGNAFAVHGLSDEPNQDLEEVNGQPYEVLTWHAGLSAIKEGDFPVDAELDVTVLMPNRARRLSSPFGRDFFDDGFFDGFFGGGYEKKVVHLSSREKTMAVRGLPLDGRPETFDGAVGTFRLSVEASPDHVAVGDPITVHATIEGRGNFDLVSSPALAEPDGWKVYAPSVRFEAGDSAGFAGKKVFEQVLVPDRSDLAAVSPLRFSYFDPAQRQFRTIESEPLAIHVIPAPGGPSLAAVPPLEAAAGAGSMGASPGGQPAAGSGLAPSHIEMGRTHRTLRPLYADPVFLGGQALSVLCLFGGTLLLRRRREHLDDPGYAHAKRLRRRVRSDLAGMDHCLAAGDAEGFLRAACSAVRHRLGESWRQSPESVSAEDIRRRLNGRESELSRLFEEAHAVSFSGRRLSREEMEQWRKTVIQELDEIEVVK